MKKFSNPFMKLTLVFTVISSASFGAAFAQTDYNEINSRNAKETPVKKPKKSLKDNEVVNFFIETNFNEHSLPKNRKLNAIEKDQKKLLKCVTNFIDKRKGLYDGPAIMSSILTQAMDKDQLTADSYALNEATEKCQEAYKNLTQFKHSDAQEEILDTKFKELAEKSASPAESTVASFIARQYDRRFRCNLTDVSAQAGLMLGFQVGVSALKCINSAGVIRNYIGPRAGVKLAFGASVSVSKTSDVDHFVTDIIAGADLNGDPDTIDSAFILGSANEGYSNYQELKRKTQLVGVGFFAEELLSGSLNLRVFNGLRNWSYVIDQLKN